MGTCSYCFIFRSFEWGSECFSWSEASGCLGIKDYSSEHPSYIKSEKTFYRDKAIQRLSEIERELKIHHKTINSLLTEQADLKREFDL